MKNYIQIITIVFTLILFSVQSAYAQPPNDPCSGAFPVTPDGTCYGPGLPQTTTVGANDLWIGTVGCQAGNNPEVWFSFVATGTQLDITITNGTMGGNIEFILVESTSPPCGGLVLEGSLCGPSVLTGTVSNSMTVGATYYYTISSSTGSLGTFTTCVTSTTPPPNPGQDCINAQTVCDNSPISVGILQLGNGVVNENFGCIGSEQSSQWYEFTAGTAGTFELMLEPNDWTSPNGGGDDYDWSFFDITTSCPTAASTPLACDYSFCPGSTGFSGTGAAGFGQVGGTDYQDNNPTGPGTCVGGPQWNTTTVNLVAGNTYGLFIQNYSTSNGGVDISFGGTATMGQPATFTASFNATCLTVTVDRTPFYIGANSTYFWSFGDGFTSTLAVPAPYTYAVAGNYTISLTVTDAVGCVSTFSIPVSSGCVLPIELTSFNAEVKNNAFVKLDWITASEINNDFFTIEKSKDGQLFEEVGIVDGAGNSSKVNSYSLVDDNPYTGVSYYRLKQTDFDNNFTYSDIVTAKVKSVYDDLVVYPNPVTGVSYLSFNANISSNTTVNVYDVCGRKVISKSYFINEGSNKLQIDTDNLTQGMYFLHLENGEENKAIKFVKE